MKFILSLLVALVACQDNTLKKITGCDSDKYCEALHGSKNYECNMKTTNCERKKDDTKPPKPPAGKDTCKDDRDCWRALGGDRKYFCNPGNKCARE